MFFLRWWIQSLFRRSQKRPRFRLGDIIVLTAEEPFRRAYNHLPAITPFRHHIYAKVIGDRKGKYFLGHPDYLIGGTDGKAFPSLWVDRVANSVQPIYGPGDILETFLVNAEGYCAGNGDRVEVVRISSFQYVLESAKDGCVFKEGILEAHDSRILVGKSSKAR